MLGENDDTLLSRVKNAIASTPSAWSDEPIGARLDRREIDDLAANLVALVETEAGATEPKGLPDGDYAIAEIMGHRKLIGRVTEVERFGAKLMSIEPVLNGELLPPVLVGGSSIYQFTPCSKERAAERAPKEAYYLPASIRAALPPTALPAPSFDEVDDEDEEEPFR